MSLIIKGMEMPTERPVWVAIFPDGSILEWNKAQSAARAIPLPEKHGRLIDADAIPFVESEDGVVHDFAYRYDINEMPPIVPAEGGEDE